MLTGGHWDEIQGLIQLHSRHLSSAVLAVLGYPFCPPGQTLQQGADPTEDILQNLKKSKLLYTGQKMQNVEVNNAVSACEVGEFSPIMFKGNEIKYVCFKWSQVTPMITPFYLHELYICIF